MFRQHTMDQEESLQVMCSIAQQPRPACRARSQATFEVGGDVRRPDTLPGDEGPQLVKEMVGWHVDIPGDEADEWFQDDDEPLTLEQ